jgi:hypothetical protein
MENPSAIVEFAARELNRALRLINASEPERRDDAIGDPVKRTDLI